MRDYRCKFAMLGNEPKMQACWGGLQTTVFYAKDSKIIIDDYRVTETSKYVNLLVKIINKIQPCELITQGDKTYICYTRIGLYNNDLILLNFIRNLWNEPISGYSVAFFEELSKLETKKLSAMEKLLTANRIACEKAKSTYSYGHSNCHKFAELVIKKLPKTFHSQHLSTTHSFLTND